MMHPFCFVVWATKVKIDWIRAFYSVCSLFQGELVCLHWWRWDCSAPSVWLLLLCWAFTKVATPGGEWTVALAVIAVRICLHVCVCISTHSVYLIYALNPMLFQAARREGSTEPFKVFPVAALCPRRKPKGKNNKCSQLRIHLPKYPATSNTDRFTA